MRQRLLRAAQLQGEVVSNLNPRPWGDDPPRVGEQVLVLAGSEIYGPRKPPNAFQGDRWWTNPQANEEGWL